MKRKERVYISGKITGCPNYKEKFSDAEAFLRRIGCKPVNPTKWGEKKGKGWEWYMRKDIRLLTKCDSILLLEDWIESKGAMMEEYVARMFGIKRYMLSKVYTLDQFARDRKTRNRSLRTMQ